MSTDKAVSPPLPEAVREQIPVPPYPDPSQVQYVTTWRSGWSHGYRAGREAAAQQERARLHEPQIDCPLCGVTVKQVASATLSLALWQHVNWVCQSAQQERARQQQEREHINGYIAKVLSAVTDLQVVASHPPPTPEDR